ncbi:hypothetical protein IWW38_000682 [Coemansia aciculifera]|uniref:Uncharacterized protein n=1 Tax=Coemansia aciculifera TaxID=417176 RepID=A0ACC1M9F0_9FUNG|nr:hypothetical protein IWW38_000682 [Coemansia aciculifera]
MRSIAANIEYALTFRNAAGMDITKKVFGGSHEPKHIRLWLSRNLIRDFYEKGIVKSKNATLTLMWSIPKDKQQGKPLGANILGPLHNIEGTVRANRDLVDFTKGLFVVVKDPAASADNSAASDVKVEEEGDD